MRHSKGYVNHAARKLLATGIVPENARSALNEKGDPRSGIWVRTPATRLDRGLRSITSGGINGNVILMSESVNLTFKDKKVESQSQRYEEKDPNTIDITTG